MFRGSTIDVLGDWLLMTRTLPTYDAALQAKISLTLSHITSLPLKAYDSTDVRIYHELGGLYERFITRLSVSHIYVPGLRSSWDEVLEVCTKVLCILSLVPMRFSRDIQGLLYVSYRMST